MTKNEKKTFTTIVIILVSLIVYVVYIYLKANEDKMVPPFSGVIFALIPALLINLIWNRKGERVNKKL